MNIFLILIELLCELVLLPLFNHHLDLLVSGLNLVELNFIPASLFLKLLLFLANLADISRASIHGGLYSKTLLGE